jgi:hypothetical protein
VQAFSIMGPDFGVIRSSTDSDYKASQGAFPNRVPGYLCKLEVSEFKGFLALKFGQNPHAHFTLPRTTLHARL